jgi:hypothetical protein
MHKPVDKFLRPRLMLAGADMDALDAIRRISAKIGLQFFVRKFPQR